MSVSVSRVSSILLLALFLAFQTSCSKSQSQVAEPNPTAAAQASPAGATATTATTEPAQGEAPLAYTTKRGETVTGIARHFLTQSSLMTTGELEAAIRKANGLPAKVILKPGQILNI